LFVLPGIVTIIVLRYVCATFGNVPVIVAFFGLKAAVLAIVVEALVRIGKRAFKSRSTLAIAPTAFVGIFFLAIPFPIIVFGAAILGWIGAAAKLPGFQLQGAVPPRRRGRPSSIVCSGTSFQLMRGPVLPSL
jgi:chromate transporter